MIVSYRMGNIPCEAIMFDTLLESTRGRDTHASFTMMSVVAHVALVAAAAAVTTSTGTAADAPRPPEPVDVIYTVPERIPDQDRSERRADRPRRDASPEPRALPAIDHPGVTSPPIEIPAVLPPIDAPGLPHPGDFVPTPGTRATGPVTGAYLASGGSEGGALTPEMVERVVALRVRASPVYPPSLQRLGVEGAVRARFVVDTLGRVEPASVDIRASAHEAFSESVRDAVLRLRFRPAQVGGRPVRQLVEMPFIFSLTR